MPSEENVKRQKLQEKYVNLEKESINLRGEVESITEVIRLLQAKKTNTEDHKAPPSEDIIKKWQTPNKTASQKQPLRFTPLVETRNRFNILSDENKNDNSADKKNDTFAIQMENIKLKCTINYLEKIIQDKDHLYKKEHASKEIMQSEHSINQTNREEKEKNTRKKDHKQSETTLITGDSMLKNINPRGLVKKTNTIVRTFTGATVT